MLFETQRIRRIANSSQQGFSFVEVIISLFVLSIGFLGVVNLSTATLRSSFLQRDATIASMLVQEGIELVYNVRDTNLVRGVDSFDGSPSDVYDDINPGSYKIGYSNPNLFSTCSTFATCRLMFIASGSNTLFGYGSGTPTKFARRILVEDTSTGGARSRKVTSVVVWGETEFPGSIDSDHCNKSTHCTFSQTELQEN